MHVRKYKGITQQSEACTHGRYYLAIGLVEYKQ